MNFYEKEMRTMFEGNEIIRNAKFCGMTMFGRLDDDLRVKLQFISTMYAGRYDAIRADIINRTDGVVDKQTFKFSDIIGKQQRRNLDEIDPYMWEYNGKTKWYIPITDGDKVQIADAVLDYVGMYQNEGMDMGGMNLS